MNTEEKIKKTISEIKVDIVEIKKELENPNCPNRTGKLQSIKYAEEMILDFEKALEEMKSGK